METIDFSYFWWDKNLWELDSYLEIVKTLGDFILKTIVNYKNDHFLDPVFDSKLNAFCFTFPHLLNSLRDEDVPKLFFNHLVYFEELCRLYDLNVNYISHHR